MRCRIAGLITEVPDAGGMSSRCKEYACPETFDAEIVIRSDYYCESRYDSRWSFENVAYVESGHQFHYHIVKYAGFYLHASAVVLEGKAYLFSGPSGVGKSTHTRLWQQIFGPDTRVINDDKPVLRCIEGIWYAYGTPWCGKDGINLNQWAPVAGVCFMKQASANQIRRLNVEEALQNFLRRTRRKFASADMMHMLLDSLDSFLQIVPVYELENRPEPEAALLSHATMLAGAEQAGL